MTTTFLQARAAGLACLALVLLSNCSPSEVAPPPRDGAAADTVADLPRDLPAGDVDVAADGAPADVLRDGPCGDGGVCGGGQRCDATRMRCVDCLAADHCGGATPVCASGRCVAATPCSSSRMCLGQVCDLNAMRCVDCVTDAECDMGQRCVANVCGAPITCRSSRDCSAGGLVCNVAQMRCVECLEDRDCAMGSACTGGNVCRVSAFRTRGPDGAFYGAGGYESDLVRSLDRFRRFDPVVGTTAPLAPMASRRYQLGIALLPGGRILVAGGSRYPLGGGPESAEYLNSAAIYTIATNTWR